MSCTQPPLSLAILIETDYQSGGTCDETTCTKVEGLVLKNLVFHNSSSPGRIVCSEIQPCSNITLDNVQINGFFHNEWGPCRNVVSSTFSNVLPTGLEDLCGLTKQNSHDNIPTDDENNGNEKLAGSIVLLCIFATAMVAGLGYHFRHRIRYGLNHVQQYFSGSQTSSDLDKPFLDHIIFETTETDTIVV